MSEEEGVTPFEEARDVSRMAVTPPMWQRGSGRSAVVATALLGHRAGINSDSQRCDETEGKPALGGECVPALKLYRELGRPAAESRGQNRTGENPPSGIAGGLVETYVLWESD
jgi:hypothetical protein